MINFAAATFALTNSLLFRWLLLLAGICVVIAGVLIGWRRLDRALEERRRVRDLRKYRAAVEVAWDRLGDVERSA